MNTCPRRDSFGNRCGETATHRVYLPTMTRDECRTHARETMHRSEFGMMVEVPA
ncbi:MAG: hypothetical protein WAQ75_02345 [Propionicimonas sp.]